MSERSRQQKPNSRNKPTVTERSRFYCDQINRSLPLSQGLSVEIWFVRNRKMVSKRQRWFYMLFDLDIMRRNSERLEIHKFDLCSIERHRHRVLCKVFNSNSASYPDMPIQLNISLLQDWRFSLYFILYISYFHYLEHRHTCLTSCPPNAE